MRNLPLVHSLVTPLASPWKVHVPQSVSKVLELHDGPAPAHEGAAHEDALPSAEPSPDVPPSATLPPSPEVGDGEAVNDVHAMMASIEADATAARKRLILQD
jgi:hypothetical protein